MTNSSATPMPAPGRATELPALPPEFAHIAPLPVWWVGLYGPTGEGDPIATDWLGGEA
ncbi:hypothetical protein [Streptomyces klenkii]|uniref:hypothetical protein n=1 Tax=Streptomyces klenkii TaxID=1420899 RepID=UPI001319C83D|nr:hypothetical protein [Streptomyces klenkii]